MASTYIYPRAKRTLIIDLKNAHTIQPTTLHPPFHPPPLNPPRLIPSPKSLITPPLPITPLSLPPYYYQNQHHHHPPPPPRPNPPPPHPQPNNLTQSQNPQHPPPHNIQILHRAFPLQSIAAAPASEYPVRYFRREYTPSLRGRRPCYRA